MADNKVQVDFELNDSGVKKGLDNISTTANKSVKPLLAIGAAAAAASVAVAAIITKKSIDAAADYEEVVNRLNVALASSGQFTKDASDRFREFAEEMQRTTKFSDDQVLSSAALIQNLGRLSKDGLEQATKATLDLSSALGIDLNAASLLVGKAASGNVSAFSRYGLSIQKGKNDTETFANTLKTLELRFGGAAEAASNTFAGSLAQLKNAFDDIFKELGRSIVKSPAVIAFIGEFNKLFSSITDSIKSSLGSDDIFKPLLSNVITVAAFLTSTFGPVFESIGRIGVASFNAIVLGINTLKTGFLGLGALIEKTLNILKISDSTFFADAAKESFEQLTVSAVETGDAILDVMGSQGNTTTAVLDFMANVKGAVDETSGSLNEFTDGVKNIPQAFEAVAISSNDAMSAFTDQFKMQQIAFQEGTEGYAQASQAAKDKIVSDFQQMGLAARNGLGQAAGQGFAAFGKALASGENSLKAFANAFIGAIGSTMVSEGTGMILRGIGYSLDPFLSAFGPPLIQAGAALATFGGAMQALSGGGGGGAAGGGVAAGGGGAGGLDSPETTEFNDELAPEKPAITVNVQGNVLDRRETGLELVSIINEAFDTQGFATV